MSAALDLAKPLNLRAEMARRGLVFNQLLPYHDPERGYVDPLDDAEMRVEVRRFMGQLWQAALRLERAAFTQPGGWDVSAQRAEAKAQDLMQALMDSVEQARADRRSEREARGALRAALGEVWSGAGYEDTDAVLDQLDDLGYRVVAEALVRMPTGEVPA